MTYDLLIQQGEVIDPSQSLRGIRDIAVHHGRIAAVGERLEGVSARETIDARGLLVTPGLIDLHVHVYSGHMPLGLDPDPLCPAGGVTTMLDAGSAGSSNFEGFRRDIIDRSATRILGLVNLCRVGLVAASLGELLDRRYADRAGVVETLRRHPDVAVGVKIRAGKHIIGEGEQGWWNFKEAVAAAREAGSWLMVHIGECPMTLPEMVEHLQPGDCITHCFKGGSTRVTDDAGRIHPELVAAAKAGVVFDIGHGYGSFNWEVAEQAIEQGFPPTTISTDLHTMNINGPVYDMPTTMSKFLMLGVPLDDVVRMSSTRPAEVLGRAGELGTLAVGSIADIAILERREGAFVFTDSYRRNRIGRELLVAAATVRSGRIVPGGGGLRMRRLPD